MLQEPTQKYVVQHWIWLQDCLPLKAKTASTGDQFDDKHVLHLVSSGFSWDSKSS